MLAHQGSFCPKKIVHPVQRQRTRRVLNHPLKSPLRLSFKRCRAVVTWIALLLSLLAVNVYAAKAVDDSVSVIENQSVNISVLANDVDDHLDAVFANYDQANRVCFGDGEGGFSRCVDVSDNSFQSSAVALGDVNGDGQADAVFANYGNTNQVCLSDGIGRFHDCMNVSNDLSSDSLDVSLADINGDNRLDAVFANSGQPNLVCIGDGEGNFSCDTIDNDKDYRSSAVSLGYIDEDGILDAVFANEGEDNIICIGNGTGSFKTCNSISDDPPRLSYDVAIMNENGVPNVIFADKKMNRKCVFDTGKFSCNENISDKENFSQSISIGDMDGKDKLDVVFANNGHNEVCLSQGTGGFSCSEIIDDNVDSRGVALGNIDDDNRLDIIFANYDKKNHICLSNESGDFSCDDVSNDSFKSEDVALGFLGFDTDTMNITTPPQYGTATVNAEGMIIYTPHSGFTGTDTFIYQVETATAKVTVNVSTSQNILFNSHPTPSNTLIFDDSVMNTPESFKLNISEAGNAPLKVYFDSVDGAHARDFKIVAPEFPLTINNGDKPVAVIIQCTPSEADIRTATLKFRTNASNTYAPSYSLECRGRYPAEYSSDPTPERVLDFGNTPVGQSVVQEIIVEETGGFDLEVSSPAINGDHAEDFKVIAPAFPLTIADGAQAKTIRVRCIPSEIGLRTATLKIGSNDPKNATPTYYLECTGFNNIVETESDSVAAVTNKTDKNESSKADEDKIMAGPPPCFKLSPPERPINLGRSVIGGSVSKEMTIKECGDETNLLIRLKESLIDNCTLSGIPPPEKDYLEIPAGSSKTVTLTCSVSDIGLYTGTLAFDTNKPSDPEIASEYTGTCPNKISISSNFYPPSEPLNLGVEPVGYPKPFKQSVSAQVWDCDAPAQLTTIGIEGEDKSEFEITEQSCEYSTSEGQYDSNCSYTIVFLPTKEGIKDAKLYFEFDNPNVQIEPRSLQAEAVSFGKPKLSVTPEAHDFGTVTSGNSIGYQEVIAENLGDVNLRIYSIDFTGEDSGDFRDEYEWWYSSSSFFYLQYFDILLFKPKESLYISHIKFAPKSPGEKYANFTFISNDPDSIRTEIPLSGFAEQPVQDCTDASVTIESLGNGSWYSPETWSEQRTPSRDDVVRISHTILSDGSSLSALFLKAKALCINKGGLLKRKLDGDHHTVFKWLAIIVKDYLENKGTIENASRLFLQVGSKGTGNTVHNEGSITAGSIDIESSDFINTQGGIVRASDGHSLTDTQPGHAGSGGSVSIRANNYLYHDSYRGIYAGNGGDCNYAADQIAGYGGDISLKSPRIVLQGPVVAGKSGKNCDIGGRDGWVRIDPNVMKLSGANTKIEGGDIIIYGGKDWILDLSGLNQTAINATGDITLAVGEGGLIDLRNNNQIVIETEGQVNIFSDTIALDEHVTLSDLIKARDIVVGPNKIIYDMSLNGLGYLVGQPETTATTTFSLANDGPETDTYRLEVTDSANWPLSPLPPFIEVKGLGIVELAIEVTLPATLGATDLITVTATSQTDPTVTATQEIQLIVTEDNGSNVLNMFPPDELTHIEQDVEFPQANAEVHNPQRMTAAILEQCPTTGLIDWMCSNHNQTITDALLGPNANLAGGTLAGLIDNEGLISQVTIRSDALVIGGKLTGYIDNQGTLMNFEFVGAELRGGTLAGTVLNTSPIGGTLIDVHLAADTHVIGGSLQGHIVGTAEAPALLEQLVVKAGSRLAHVIIGKQVKLPADTTLLFEEGVQLNQP